MGKGDNSVPWRDYVDGRFIDSFNAVKIAQEAAEKAVDKADSATARRFEGVDKQMDDIRHRLELVTNRLNGLSGEEAGEDKSTAARQAVIALVIAAAASGGSILFLIVAIATHGKF